MIKKKMFSLRKLFADKKREVQEEGVLRKEEKMTINFGGEDQISLDTLRECLDITVDTMKSIANQNLSKDDYCKLYIQDVRHGSFEMVIGLIVSIVGGIASKIPDLIQIFVETIKMRKHLRGKEPKSIEKNDNKVILENCSGIKMTVNNNTYVTYVNDNMQERGLARMSNILAKDSARTGLSVIHTNEEGEIVDEVDMTKEDLAETSTALDVEKLDNTLVEKIDTQWVRVRKGIFIGDSKWEFVTWASSVNFSASIEDKDFIDKFHKGEIIITPESLLKVELRCRMRCGEDDKVVGKTTYAVMKVMEIEAPQRSKQMSLFDKDI